MHPLAALYRKPAVLPVIERMMSGGRLKMKDIAEMVRTRVVDEEDMLPVDPSLGTLRNLNHPEDYERALGDGRRNV